MPATCGSRSGELEAGSQNSEGLRAAVISQSAGASVRFAPLDWRSGRRTVASPTHLDPPDG